MTYKKVKVKCFAPNNKNNGQKSLISCFVLLALSGCTVAKNHPPLAISPPEIGLGDFSTQDKALYQPHYFAPPPQQNQGLPYDDSSIIKNTLNTVITAKNNCKLKDRIDRKSLVAYEWGRNKLSLDVDGINLRASSTKALLIEYKLRLQPEKTRKQKCRFSSNWQGLIGSSYNEVFVRKDNKLWSEITSAIKEKISLK